MYLGFLIMSVYERWIEYVYIGVEGEGGDDNIVTDGAQPPVSSIYYLQYPVSTAAMPSAVTTVCTPHTSVMR